MLTEWLAKAGGWFTPEQYLLWTRVEGLAWTLADLVIVWYLLRLGNLCRASMGRRQHRIAYAVLAMTLPFVALLPFAQTGMAFFFLELLVTIPHFVLIVYALLTDAPIAAQALHRMLAVENRRE